MIVANPGDMVQAAGPLRSAAEVSRDLHLGRSELKTYLSDAGADRVKTAGEGFLEAWGEGVGRLMARGEALAQMLDLAASSYTQAETDVRRAFGAAGDAS